MPTKPTSALKKASTTSKTKTPKTETAAAKSRRRSYSIKALVLQGGGALGAYQAGVYEGLADSGHHPNWVAGISIGALNAAIVAGNAPEQRVEKLRAFWEYICQQPLLPQLPFARFGKTAEHWPNALRTWVDSLEASRAMFEGQRGFFTPRSWFELAFAQRGPDVASFYDTRPMKETLEKFADFDRINQSGEVRVSVGAVNVRTGNFAYFDNTEIKLTPEHFMASGALPPGFPAVEIDGEFYWDGGIVSNTPLHYVLAAEPRRDSLVFQVDLWSAHGDIPTNLLEVATRQKEVQYSSRTRLVTSWMQEKQEFRNLLRAVLDQVPPSKRDNEWCRRAEEVACTARINVIHMIYRNRPFEGAAKDFQFGLLTMQDHWASGLEDIRNTVAHPEWLAMPTAKHPFVTHDLHRIGPEESHVEAKGGVTPSIS
ncbi:MAG: patatin-like phospholipase family protein [Spongiibacteraceae bacterium]